MESKSSVTPLGVKIIAGVIGFTAFIGFGAVMMRFARPSSNPQELPIRIMLLVFSGMFAAFAVNLWKGKNWARICVMVFSALMFLSMTYTLVKTQTFPDPLHWWHFYIYPAIVIYLNLPAVKSAFQIKLSK